MQEYFGKSLGKGIVHGKIVLEQYVIEPTTTQPLALDAQNLLIAFLKLPDLATFLKSIKIPGATGFIIPECSPYSHLAWAISYFNAPTIMYDANALEGWNKTVYLDLDRSAILIPESLAEEQFLERKEATHFATARSILSRAPLPATTKSGFHIEVLAQIQSIDDVTLARDNGADGVGEIKSEILVRSETFQDAIYPIVQSIRSLTQWQSIPLRFFDFASDKLPLESSSIAPQGALGYRGIRRLEIDPSLMDKFLEELDGINLDDIVVVLPMVTLPVEVEQFRKRLGNYLPRLGVEIETPAAALSIDSLLELSNYFVIGTNDLTQFTMAWDRTIPHQDRLPPNRLSDPVAQFVRKITAAARKKQAFSSLALDLWPSEDLLQQILDLEVKAITVSPRLVPMWKERVRLTE